MGLRRRGSELLNSMTLPCPLIKFLGTKFVLNSHCACGLSSLSTLLFWCRCGWGTHPFPSRTRRLRPNRPMVLHWRRCGRAGGRQIKRKKQAMLPDINRTGTGKWVLLGTGWSQKIIDKSGANLDQPGKAVIIAGFYQWFKMKRYFHLKWLIKHQSVLYLENCIHEDLIKLIKYP